LNGNRILRLPGFRADIQRRSVLSRSGETAPLAPGGAGPLRIRELPIGVGARSRG
jgi:hypothetical protein